MKCFDFEEFYRSVDHKRRRQRKRWRQVADEAGVSPSSITRLGQGKSISVNTLARLSDWAGLVLDLYVKDEPEWVFNGGER